MMVALEILLAGCAQQADRAQQDEKDEFADYTTCLVEESCDMDAFENAGFEDTAKYGRVDEHVEIGRFGYNGNGGARVWTRPNQTYCFVLKAKPALNLRKNRRYVLSAYIRTHGDMTCQTCADVFLKNPRKYVFGAWGPAREQLNDGWVRHTVEFVPKNDYQDLDYKFMVYCRADNGADFNSLENYVEVDNVAIHTAAPKWYFCNTWPTHNMIYSDVGRIRVHSDFLGQYCAENAAPLYVFQLKTPEGKVLAKKKLKADEDGNMTVDFGRVSYSGKAIIVATLYDLANKINLGSREIEVTVGPMPDTSKGLFVPENGVVLKDGRPYMPIGFYTGFAYADKYTTDEAEAAMRKLRDAGFNAMIDYGTFVMNDKRRDWYYSACEKYGIGVLNDDFKICSELEKVPERMPQYRAAAIRDLKYPSLIGYYIMDEGVENFVAPLTKIRRMLNEVAPGRMVNICNIMRPSPYLPCADIQGGDSYPIKRGGDLRGTDDYLKKLFMTKPAAVWFAPQAYNWASMVPGALKDATLYAKSGREPNENETLSVVLLMVSRGVNGFFFYSYYDIFRCPIKEWIPKRWEYVCKACKCLRDLEPFIMSGEEIVELPHVDKGGRTRIVTLSDGKGAHRVLVIGLEKGHETSFQLPGEFGRLKSRCGNIKYQDGNYVFRGADFTCDVLE